MTSSGGNPTSDVVASSSDYENACCLGTLLGRMIGHMDEPTDDLPRAGWQANLDDLTRQHEGHEVTIELLDRELGDEEEVARLPLSSIGFDPKDDVVIVAVGGRDGRFPVVLRHMVENPQRIVVDSHADDGRVALDVVDGDGDHTIVTIWPPAAR